MTHKCIKTEYRHHTIHLQGERIKALQGQKRFSRRSAFAISVAVVLRTLPSRYGVLLIYHVQQTI